MSKSEIIQTIKDCRGELEAPLSNLNSAMEDLLNDSSLSIEDKDMVNYWYMQLNGTGFIDDLVNAIETLVED